MTEPRAERSLKCSRDGSLAAVDSELHHPRAIAPHSAWVQRNFGRDASLADTAWADDGDQPPFVQKLKDVRDIVGTTDERAQLRVDVGQPLALSLSSGGRDESRIVRQDLPLQFT